MRYDAYNTYKHSSLEEQERWIGKTVGLAAMGIFAYGVVKLGILIVSLGTALAHFQSVPRPF